MTRDNRQILINPHSSQEKVPVGSLNLGEIAVQHNNVEDAALYVETVANSESANTIAKFITEKAIESRIGDAMDILQMSIDGINEAVGLPHETKPGETHHWDSSTTVWDAIEQTYADMAAGTAAANTRVEKDLSKDDTKYLTLDSEVNEATSSITYTIGLDGISDYVDSKVESAYTILDGVVKELSAGNVSEIESAYTILSEKIETLSSATLDVLDGLDYTGVTENGQAIVNVTEENGVITATQGDISSEHVTVDSDLLESDNVAEALDEIAEKITANEVEVAKLTAEEVAALSDANVKEAYKLIHSDDSGRTAVGDIVKIYKDSALYDTYLGHVDDTIVSANDPTVVEGSGDTALCLIYEKKDGTYELVAIDVNDFLEESEFQDGLTVDNHIVKVLVDPESEEVEIASGETAPVLSVSEDGVKISNIQNAINYAVELLAHNMDADVTGSDDHVSVEVVQTDTEITDVIVTTLDIASEAELNTVEEAVGLAQDGSFVPIESNYASGATTVIEGIQAIDRVLKTVSDKLSGAEVFETGSTENWVSLTVEETEPGKTGITLDDSELAEELVDIHDSIDAEAAARGAADAELLGTTASTKDEASIYGIKAALADALTNLVTSVQFAPVSETRTFSAAESGVAATIDDNEDGKTLKLDFTTLKVDCGEY